MQKMIELSPSTDTSCGSATSHAAVPLVVDMDGTLLRTNVSSANLLALAAGAPRSLLRLPRWLLQHRNLCRANIADIVLPPIESLPLNPDCVALITKRRAVGARVVLVSGADERIVAAVARQVGLFDEWYGSSRAINLSGANKAAEAVRLFGERGFDYIGDSVTDLPAWRAARHAYTLGASPALRARATKANASITHLAQSPGGLSWLTPLWRAMRPHQWVKNILVFAPLLAGHSFAAGHLAAAFFAFIAFSLTASSAYLVNDLFDLEADRAHPRKRHRPLAAGDLSLQRGGLAALSLAVCAGVISLTTLPLEFDLLLSLYFIATLSYSLWLKKKVFLDIFVLATLYTLRIIGGAVAIGISVSPWLLAFSMFFFLALAVVKRLVELQTVIRASPTRGSKRDYWAEDLGMIQALGAASGYLSVLVLALYFNSPEALALYSSPELLWGICPLLLFWISRMLILSNRGKLHDDPIVHTARDRVSYLVGGAIAIVIAASVLL
ncbi:MAG: UbiA family prenyltransferase [Steroidobacteraceae bacterium]